MYLYVAQATIMVTEITISSSRSNYYHTIFEVSTIIAEINAIIAEATIIFALATLSYAIFYIPEPLPMKLRALPQSFWIQPNRSNNLPPSGSLLPPLMLGKDPHDIIGEHF